MSGFALLSDPDSYVPLHWDLTSDQAAREQWLDVFSRVFDDILGHATRRYGRDARSRIEDARQEFSELVASLREHPTALPSGRLDLVELDRARDKVLRMHRLEDALDLVKDHADARAADMYPELVHRLHTLEDADKWEALVRGVFAGNLFDLGIDPEMRPQEEQDFLAAIEATPQRPWFIDDFDALSAAFAEAPPARWSKAVFFVDNAGSDFILGALPLAREMAMAGTAVVLAANERPSLNDVTVNEVVDIVERLAGQDRDLDALIVGNMMEAVSTGTDLPVLDLSEVSDELNEAAEDADLVVLEGMGRSVETNFDAEFRVDALRLSVVKNEQVASRIGCDVNDCICRYTPAAKHE